MEILKNTRGGTSSKSTAEHIFKGMDYRLAREATTGQGVVAYTFNPSTPGAEAGGSL